jgi:SAM-dependent methyltransferase
VNLRRFRHRLKKSLVDRGLIGTATAAVQKTVRVRGQAPSQGPPKQFAAVHPFDALYGVETSGLLQPEDLSNGRRSDLYNNGYFGIAPSVFRQICGRLQIDFRNFTFVDLGSGKGRALLLASEFPFEEIIGVELSPKLHQIALGNVTRYHALSRQCAKIRCLQRDAAEYDLPAGPLVIYMWNAFERPIFEKVVANLEASLRREPREIYALYVHPDFDSLMTASPLLRRLWLSEFEMSEEDYAAYAFPPRTEVCAAYQSVLA